jgi:cytidylate kinase
MATNTNIIIAVDGASSTGKSTLAKDIARRLRIKYIDSGAMYRAVTLYALRKKIYNPETGKVKEQQLKKVLPELTIDFYMDPLKGEQSTLLNGEVVEDEIREMEVNESVSQISQLNFVREKLVEKQRAFGLEGGVVMDGRDIGTVVFPHANVKLYLTASAEVKAKRRFEELRQKGYKVSLEEVKENVTKRDQMDETREESPLRKAPDAVVIDNSNLDRKQQLEEAMKIIREKTGIIH